MKISLPGELQPYEVVAIYPKVTGFVDWIDVDRGSRVRNGQLIIRLVAPELTAQRSEAQAKLQNAEAQRVEAEAKLAADHSTYQRLKAAASTPGVVAGNDLDIAQQAAEADRARVRAALDNVNAAKQSLRSVAEMEAHNANYVRGDVVTGSNDPLQLVFRPRVALDPYLTGILGVYLCSAATPPGAGAHGMCGYNAARSALRRLRAGARAAVAGVESHAPAA